jgi:hypothetical protein
MRVTFRDDQTFLTNGAPFFPIGLYYPHEEIADPTGKALSELRDMGFNYLFYAGEPKADQLERIRAAGLLIHYRPPGSLYTALDKLPTIVESVRRHPSLLLWEMEDEPVLNKVDFEQSKRGYELMKQLDPDHPVLVNHWPNPKYITPEQLAQWGTVCDINGFDFYPVPLKRWEEWGKSLPAGWAHSIGIMGRLTEQWRKTVPGKTVLVVLQAWSWDPLKFGEEGYPTLAESRFMLYHVVIAGAKGVSYYGQIQVKTPNTAVCIPPEIDPDPAKAAANFEGACKFNRKFWEGFHPVVREAADMGTVFAARDAGWKLSVQTEKGDAAPHIEYRVKQIDKDWVVLMVNNSAAACKMRISIGSRSSGGRIAGWYPEKTWQANTEGRFEDTLEPFAVRVYSNQPRDVILRQPSSGR